VALSSPSSKLLKDYETSARTALGNGGTIRQTNKQGSIFIDAFEAFMAARGPTANVHHGITSLNPFAEPVNLGGRHAAPPALAISASIPSAITSRTVALAIKAGVYRGLQR
jgi:hypothetical protein